MPQKIIVPAPKKRGHYTEVCRRCDEWRNQRIRHTCRKRYEKSRPRTAEITPTMTRELKEAVQRGPSKMNNKRRFIMEETRIYINKRDKEEKLNRRKRQLEYSNGPTDVRMEDRRMARKPKQKGVSFQDERIEMETPLQKEWEEVHFVYRGNNIEPCKTKAQNKKYYKSIIICSQLY